MTPEAALPAVRENRGAIGLAVLVAALGYFVDIYDLILFTIVRRPSLQDLHVPADQLLSTGVWLLNWQNFGLLSGGILWGVLGDRRGRLSVLFGSILLYSLCNLANAIADTVPQYAVLRFLAGVGLAGELGAGVTLVSEIMSKEHRGWGSTIIGGVGMCGGVTAGLVGDLTTWRTAYLIGGVLGLCLLALRLGVRESPMFRRAKESSGRGNLLLLFMTRDAAGRLRFAGGRALRYVALITLAMPIWYVVGILVTFSPEITQGLHLDGTPSVSRAVMLDYAGLIGGDLLSGYLTQRLRSRKRVLALFLVMVVFAVAAYFLFGSRSLTTFYAMVVFAGFTTGYWALFVTVASEQFGTNVRATATTTAPNFVRGAVIPMSAAFKGMQGPLGVTGSALAVGVVVLCLAFLSLRGLDETFGKDLDFVDS